jgi:hypothetical protein
MLLVVQRDQSVFDVRIIGNMKGNARGMRPRVRGSG